MKVLLVTLSFDASTVSPPIGLGYLAAMLRKEGHDAAIMDPARDRYSMDDAISHIIGQDPDLVGISIITPSYGQAKELVDRLHRDLPGVAIVTGGIHVTALPEHTLRDLGVDYGVLGEGEYTILELVDALEGKRSLGDVKGLAYRRDGQIIVNQRRESIGDVDSLPLPAWDLIQPGRYPPNPHNFFVKRLPVAPVLTSRGCTFHCKFCAGNTLWGSSCRLRSPVKVVDEIELLVRDFGVREIHIIDDNFTSNREHAMAVCRQLIGRGVDVPWKCPSGLRVDGFDRELLDLMKRAGCYQIGLGIESGNQEILDHMHKGIRLDKVKDAVSMAQEAGIEVHGYFIIGFPEETRESIQDTIRFSQSLGLDAVNYAALAYVPGSELFDEWVKDKDLSKVNWSQMKYDTPHDTIGLTTRQIKGIQARALHKFYSRPKIALKFLKKLKIRQIPYLLRIIKDYYTLHE
ncbi:B12-binding domain-containing radical SAM protein [Candidatus Altiarchaeota archaeon]